MKNIIDKRRSQINSLITTKQTSDFIRSLISGLKNQDQITKEQLQMAIDHSSKIKSEVIKFLNPIRIGSYESKTHYLKTT